MAPLLRQCCFCCSLKTGGIVLGTLGIIRAVIGIVSAAFLLALIDEAVAQVQEELKKENNPEINQSDVEVGSLVVKIILAIFIVISVVELCASVLLIIGARKNRKEYILPYLVTDGLGIIVTIIYFMITGVQHGFWQAAISAIIYLIIAGYLWLCVLSLYQWIKDVANRQPMPMTSPYLEQQAVYTTNG
ncbi:hypothetical protein DMENIID0001_028310 [Sergentomyia squamirostris]